MGDGNVALDDEPGALDAGSEAARSESEPGGTVPDAVAPPPHHRRFPLIDGMRAIAVLSVVLVHTTVGAWDLPIVGPLLTRTNIGVTIFFLISGFLLYRPFIAHRGGGAAAPAVIQYAKRRLLRIYPAYWLVLTVLVIAPGLTGVGNGEWWAHYGLVQTLTSGESQCNVFLSDCGLNQTWSLVVEMTFYAALPLYVVAAAHLARGRSVRYWMRLELLVLAVLSAVSVILHFVVSDVTERSWLTTSAIGYGSWFALGMGLAVVSVGLERRERRQPALIRLVASRPWIPWALAFATYALLTAWLPETPIIVDTGRVIVIHLAFGVIAALLLLPAVFEDGSGGLPRRLLAHPVMAWLGLISYGIFLWHYVIARQLGSMGANLDAVPLTIATLAIAIPCAAASYYLVERPLLRLKYHRVRDVVGSVRRVGQPSPAPRRVP